MRGLLLRLAVRFGWTGLAWRLGYLPGCCEYHDPAMRKEAGRG